MFVKEAFFCIEITQMSGRSRENKQQLTVPFKVSLEQKPFCQEILNLLIN